MTFLAADPVSWQLLSKLAEWRKILKFPHCALAINMSESKRSFNFWHGGNFVARFHKPSLDSTEKRVFWDFFLLAKVLFWRRALIITRTIFVNKSTKFNEKSQFIYTAAYQTFGNAEWFSKQEHKQQKWK